MRIFLTIALILSCLSGLSQKQLVVLIDTIDFIEDTDQHDFKITLTEKDLAMFGVTDSTAEISTINYPNFHTTVSLKTDSTRIHIPIDQENGYLEISNISDLDTLRINKLKLYSNCYRDITKTRIEYFRVYKDSASYNPYRVRIKEKTDKGKCRRRPPFKTMLTINEEQYFVSIQKKKSDAIEITHGHGYKPRRTEKNYEDYSGTRFYINSNTVRYINRISIRIK